VHVFTHQPKEGLAGYEDPAEYEVSRFSDWTRTHRFELAPGLWRDLHRRDHLGVVHAHSFHGSAAILAASATDGAFVFTPHFHRVGHSRLARLAHLVYDRPARRLFERADAVTCVSHAEAELVADAYPCVEKIVVVPNGIDAENIRNAQPFPHDRPIILAAGRLETYKQFDVAIRAMQHLPDAELVVCGRGPEERALRAVADACGVASRVRMLGFVSDEELHRWLRTASVTLALSRHEAFGLIALEAATARSAVVASDIPAHAELEAQLNGLMRLVPVDASPAAVADAVRDELRSHDDVEVHGVLSWADVTSQMELVYERAAAGR
jgi:glycosyltransferase involved in cell wall biosynthesis